MTLQTFMDMANSKIPESDTYWIIEEALKTTRSKIFFMKDKQLSYDETLMLTKCLERRLSGEPVQYMFGKAPFMGFEFFVDERVLIPRMDTETLAEAVIEHIKSKAGGVKLLDLCAGSGAIGISIKKLCPKCDVTISDISADANEVERINAKDTDVEILNGDMFEPVNGRKFDIIVCNPPYIETDVIDTLSAEVRREPVLALDGGRDGLDFYRRIAAEYKFHLSKGGRLYMEIGYDQSERVMNMFENSRAVNDINGIRRVIWTEV